MTLLSSTAAGTLEKLQLASHPVAMAFLPEAPEGVARIGRAQAAGCSYWKTASEGEAFYTTPDDHTGCPIGAFTHGVELAQAKAEELQSLMAMMIELKYLKREEVPAIPHRTSPMQVAAYAPLSRARFQPDVVVFRGNARQIMLLSEAARAAGIFETAAVMGRPACAMLPQAMASATAVASIGCVGNRVYTGLGDDELYLTVPGSKVNDVLAQLETILAANSALEKFHKERAGDTIG